MEKIMVNPDYEKELEAVISEKMKEGKTDQEIIDEILNEGSDLGAAYKKQMEKDEKYLEE